MSAEIPVDQAPVGTSDDLERSFQAGQELPIPAIQALPSRSIGARPLMAMGQLLIAGGLVGTALLYVQSSTAEGTLTVTTVPTTSSWLWVVMGFLVLLGIMVVVQAWRLRRAIE